jgi:hypothetical protein
MKFTLVGDYSGLHSALKTGLESLGHSAFLISDGDLRKNLTADVRIDQYLTYLPSGRLNAIVSSLLFKVPQSDHISIISPLLFGGGRFIREAASYLFLSKLLSASESVSLCAAGSDSYWLAYCKSHLAYNPFDSINDPVPAFSQFPATALNHYIASKVSIITGFTPDYYYAYNTSFYSHTPVQFVPMTGCPLLRSDATDYNPLKKTIKVLFGSNKPRFKGAHVITEALAAFGLEHSDVELVLPSMCSSSEWINCVKACDILVDQCRTYSYGVNALYGLAFGKIVLTGWNWGATPFYSGLIPPVIPIRPSVESIYESLVSAYHLYRSGRHSPSKCADFYDRFHSPVSVASRFISAVSLG